MLLISIPPCNENRPSEPKNYSLILISQSVDDGQDYILLNDNNSRLRYIPP